MRRRRHSSLFHSVRAGEKRSSFQRCAERESIDEKRMSTQQQSNGAFDLRSGLALIDGGLIHRTTFEDDGKPKDPALIHKPSGDYVTATPPQPKKSVGSNRSVSPLV